MDAKSIDTTCSRDAISWLPDEILSNILSLLPTKQAASTCVLSTKWRYVFRLVDNLDLDDSVSDNQASYELPESFKNFVDRTLALQCDNPIKKFSLKCHVGEDNDCQKTCVARWISKVVERGVLELDLGIKDPGIHFLPPQLLASKTLVKLSLGTELCLGKLPSHVSLPSLSTLFIDTVFFEYGDLCDVLLAGCPVLEELSVRHKDEAIPHTISSATVKRLAVDYCSPYHFDDNIDLSLDLPNLLYLDYAGFALSEYPLVNLDSLVEAKLDLRRTEIVTRPDLTLLILGIRNVQFLHLSHASVDVVYSCCEDGLLLPVFSNLVHLSFEGKDKRGWKLLAYLLKQSPKLENLTIQDLSGYTSDVSMPPNHVKVLHILNCRGTDEEYKHLKSFLGGKGNAEAVVEDCRISQTNKGLMMLRVVSVPTEECQA